MQPEGTETSRRTGGVFLDDHTNRTEQLHSATLRGQDFPFPLFVADRGFPSHNPLCTGFSGFVNACDRRKMEESDSASSRTAEGRGGVSLYRYVMGELSRGYLMEEDKNMFTEKQKRVSTFIKTPWELEKLMLFGIFICLDAFLFTFTFLPVRVLLSVWRILLRVFLCTCSRRWVESCELCDIFRVTILILCILGMTYIDTSALYHMVRGQSVIKLYVIYNMLEIFDRLLSSIGQDSLDALFWSTSGNEGGEGRWHYLEIIFYFVIVTVYVFIHTLVILVQTVTLNVAVNSHSKALLTIMVSNNFVELKGSVFKKFETNNLFQMSCSDIRERFHYVILLMVVSVRNLAQFNWDLGYLEEMVPIVIGVLLSEVFVDWTKHAFITKFNDISPEVYRKYKGTLARDLTNSRHRKAKSDHSDLVSRRMGFIPLPLICLVWRTLSQSLSFPGLNGAILLVTLYLCLTALKVLVGILLLGKACKYCHIITMETTNRRDSQDSTDISLSSHIPNQPESPLLIRRTAKPPPTGPMKHKSLSEVERYTLCSNRIV